MKHQVSQSLLEALPQILPLQGGQNCQQPLFKSKWWRASIMDTQRLLHLCRCGMLMYGHTLAFPTCQLLHRLARFFLFIYLYNHMKGGVKWGRTPHPLETRRSSTSGPISQWMEVSNIPPGGCKGLWFRKKKQKTKNKTKTPAQSECWVPQDIQPDVGFQEWSSRNPGQENKTLCWGFFTKDWEFFFSSHLSLIQLHRSTNRLGRKSQVARFH